MAIEGLIAEKHRIMEDLLRVTAFMQQALLTNDIDSFDSEISRRARVFEDLRRIDAQLKGHATKEDELWIKQLRMIESTDKEIMAMLAMHKKAVETEAGMTDISKRNLLADHMIDPKGNRFEARG